MTEVTLDVDSKFVDRLANTITPLADRILLLPLQNATTTAGGIVIPDTATKESSGKAQVIAVGPGTADTPTNTLKAGDVVFYSKYAGTEVKINGEKALIVKFEDVLAIEAQ